jgi:hypothetical protein
MLKISAFLFAALIFLVTSLHQGKEVSRDYINIAGSINTSNKYKDLFYPSNRLLSRRGCVTGTPLPLHL